jgi:hypothetical protein
VFYLILMCITSVISIARLVWLVLRRCLTIERDLPALIIYVQVILYMHIAPVLYVLANEQITTTQIAWDPALAPYYALIQAFSVLFFELPFYFVYRKLAKAVPASSVRQWSCDLSKAALLSGVSMVFSITFLVVSVRYNILKMPRDNTGNPYLLANLPTAVYGISRLFLYSGVFLTALHIILIRACRFSLGRQLLIASLAITGGTLMLATLLNSRLGTVLDLTLFFSVFLLSRDPATSRRIRWRAGTFRIVALMILLAYFGKVAYNIRFKFQDFGGFDTRLLDPTLADNDRGQLENDLDVRWRFNGVDLMARVTPAMIENGLCPPEPWIRWIEAAIGQYVSREAVRDLKLDRETEPKVYLLRHYAGNSSANDWPMTVMSDIYASLGPFGMMLAAATLALAAGSVVRELSRRQSAPKIMLALLLYSQVMAFELGYALDLTGWTRGAPILILLMIFGVLKIQKPARRFSFGLPARAGRAGVMPPQAGLR